MLSMPEEVSPTLRPAEALPEVSGTPEPTDNNSARDLIATAEEVLRVDASRVAQRQEHDEEALEWHEVIELQAFSERRAWIEEKIKFLEQLPPIEVFAGLEAVRSSAEEVHGLPTRAELQQWLVEHDRIEKETEVFDSGELKKLKKFTKAATQRNLSPADTDLIEMTLTTIYTLDKLLHLLRDRSDNLELLGIRLTWEERRIASWTELRQFTSDLETFLSTRARWSPSVYETVIADEEPLPRTGRPRRGSVASVASESSFYSIPSLSRGIRFKLAESLSRDAALFVGRASMLRHTRIGGAGKALDKLIDRSRRPVPDELLDEQDRLENKGIMEMEDIGKFVMNMVTQWKKADETYVETLKDMSEAQTLVEEIEVAKLNHPSSRQDANFIARTIALNKRLAIRGNPSSPGVLPRPFHHHFPDQTSINDALASLLSSELASATDHVKKAEACAKEYHLNYEAVKRAETMCKTTSDLSSQLLSIIERLEKGVATSSGDGSPPDFSTESCLETMRHSVFTALVPSILQELQKVDEATAQLLPGARAALLHLDFPGVDRQFKADATSVVNELATQQLAASQTRELVVARMTVLSDVRKVWSTMGEVFKEMEDIRNEVIESMSRQMWKQQIRTNEAPPTPESPSAYLLPRTPPLTMRSCDWASCSRNLIKRCRFHSPSLGTRLRDYLTNCSTGLTSFLDVTSDMAHFWEAIQKQAAAMAAVRDEVQDLQIHMEHLKVRFENGSEAIFAGTLSADDLSEVETSLSGDLKTYQESVQAFSDNLPLRVPFVGQARLTGAFNPALGKRRFSLSGFNLAVVQQAAPPELPFDPAKLDYAIRTDSNTYSMMLAGAVKTLQQKADHFQLAKMAKSLDLATTALTDNILHLSEPLATIRASLLNNGEQTTIEHLRGLVDDVVHLRESEGSMIARSFSPIRDLLYRLKSAPDGSDFGAKDAIVTSRQKAVDDAESQYLTWREAADTLKQQIIDAQKAEEVRLWEEVRLKEEQERLKAERLERERAEMEKARLEAEEEARIEQERKKAAQLEEAEHRRREAEDRARLEAEKKSRLEAEKKAERDRHEAEEQAKLELGRVALQVHETRRLAAASPLERVEESESELLLAQRETEEGESRFIGCRSILTVLGQMCLDHCHRLMGLQHRVNCATVSLYCTSDCVLSISATSHCRAVTKEVESLPTSVPDNITVDADLRSLRGDIASSTELMAKVHQLADFSVALRQCDDLLSDLLEHIDSYPSLPAGPMAASHISDPGSTSEQQMSARLSFSRATLDTMKSRASEVANDPRTAPESDRILQTWAELEAMALDRLTGRKSRPASVVSSGRSSRSSMMSYSGPTRKKESFSGLSHGSPGGKFLAPPLPKGRRTSSITSSSASRQAPSRSSSRMSIASNRSVSGPMSPSSTLYGSTFASRQRTASVSSIGSSSFATPAKRIPSTGSRPRAQTGQMIRTDSPTFSDASSFSQSHSRSSLSISRPSTSHSSWARAPRPSFLSLKSPPSRSRLSQEARRPYVANPKNKLDVAVGDVVNNLPVGINVEVVEDTWKDQSGKYWIGDQDPKLCFCRILRSQTVMVRVGGGWAELSKFIKEHFADAFRLLPESPPRPGTSEEKWISSTTLSQAAEIVVPPKPPKTPEPNPTLPSFALSTPSGASPKSFNSGSPGSPLTALQFIRRVEKEIATRPETPTKPSRTGLTSVLNTPARHPVWRP
ncbi:hypothetical protein A0H81_08273 [Grifola frondosa]|uniref:GAR domain-containing protein n=1 Tax=Grifola frondosa TaxID=5627 RepID=A0A1C7M5Z2_GRIFR|nr:hypothetical protein A0H81_08273 [Grifola frondosa]